jgi:hypothetical protein
MENNLQKIVERATTLVGQLAPTITGEKAEMEIIHAIADELIEEIVFENGGVEQYAQMKKALVNMFLAGQILKK